jgi:uncharacterized protein (TIGR02611 family)
VTADPSSPPKQRFAWLSAFRDRVRRLPGGRLAWRIVVTVLGVAVVAIGIVLLPLPGPGWLIIFAGLGILASEYAWARRLLVWVRDELARWRDWLRRQPLWVRVLGALLSLAVLVALALAALFIV